MSEQHCAEFVCMFANKPLTRPCEVESCNYNLDPTPIGRTYRRCLLNYFSSLRHNPYGLKQHKDDFATLPFNQRCQVVGSFFGITDKDVKKSVSKFYAAMFGVMVQDAMTEVPKSQLDPVPFKQCVVCGCESEALFYPKHGALPAGYGYCRWSCYQFKPPPIVAMELALEIDSLDLMSSIDFEANQSRPQFIRQIVQWILGDTWMN